MPLVNSDGCCLDEVCEVVALLGDCASEGRDAGVDVIDEDVLDHAIYEKA